MPMRFISVATCWRPISTPSAIKDPRPKGRGIVEVSQSPARGEQDVGLADASDERRKRRGMRPAGIQKSLDKYPLLFEDSLTSLVNMAGSPWIIICIHLSIDICVTGTI